MRLLKIVAVLVVLAGAGLLAQARWVPDSGNGPRAFSFLTGRGAEIGVSIRDVGSDDKAASGVVVEEVHPDSAAEKAGLKHADVIVEFDGERVRSARQFSRLVQETASGRTVKTTVMRDGQKKELQITPGDGQNAMTLNGERGDRMVIDGQRLRDQMNELGNLSRDHLQPFMFDNGGGDRAFSFMMPTERGRLGVGVDDLTPQLATYFGAKDGVLIVSVSEDSPASHAGLRAGDVVIKVNNEPVRTREDLTRFVADVKDGGEATIVIVRDKKESTVTVKFEARRPTRRGQPA